MSRQSSNEHTTEIERNDRLRDSLIEFLRDVTSRSVRPIACGLFCPEVGGWEQAQGKLAPSAALGFFIAESLSCKDKRRMPLPPCQGGEQCRIPGPRVAIEAIATLGLYPFAHDGAKDGCRRGREFLPIFVTI